MAETKQTDDAAKLQRLYWRSRRGMLELDLLLVPFTLEAYPTLPAAQQRRYRKLLGSEDQDLFAWLVKREPAGAWQPLIDRVLAHHAAKKAAKKAKAH